MYKCNPSTLRANKRYREKNKEILTIKRKAYYLANKEKFRIKNKKAYQKRKRKREILKREKLLSKFIANHLVKVII